jgi:hypothetical protein
MNKPKTVRQVSIATDKITKKQVDEAIAAGNTHAKFRNKGVQKRLAKNQEKIRRAQNLREQEVRRINKDRARMQSAHQILANAGKAEAVVDAGVAALGNLLGGLPQGVAAAVMAVDTEAKTEVNVELKADPKAWVDTVREHLDASIGGNLIDNDFKPENFGVQYQNTNIGDGESFLVQIDKLADNQVMLNLYGDEQNYKPLPEVGDKINANGIVAAVRKFPDCELPAEADRAALREVNFIFDSLYYSPPGVVTEVSEDGILIEKDPVRAMDMQKFGRLGSPQTFDCLMDPSSKLTLAGSAAEVAQEIMGLPTPEQLLADIKNNDVAKTYPERLEHLLDFGVAATYKQPTSEVNDELAPKQDDAVSPGSDEPVGINDVRGDNTANVGWPLEDGVAGTDEQPVKLNNAGISGAFLSDPHIGLRTNLPEIDVAATYPQPDSDGIVTITPDDIAATREAATKLFEQGATPLFREGAHETLTAQCRAITSEDVMQGEASKGVKIQQSTTFGRMLHPSQAEVGSYITTPKSEPTRGEPGHVPSTEESSEEFQAEIELLLASGRSVDVRPGHVFDPLLVPQEFCPAAAMSEAETTRMIHGDYTKPADEDTKPQGE